MDPRAQNPTALTGPTGPSLLDQSKATPADINPEIFKSRNPERQPTEGTVSSDYLKRTREEDPWPAESSCAPKTNTPAKTATVTLSDCRIDTPTEDLATDQPFQMSCQATTSDGSPPKGDIRFKLYCTLPDGTEEFTNHTVIGKRNGDRYAAEGTLFSPKKPVEWGAPLKYHVVAEHPGAAEKEKSGVAEVVGYMPPKALAVWSLGGIHFAPDSSFLLPSAVIPFDELALLLKQNPEAVFAVFSHSSETHDERLLHIAQDRAYALYALLTRDTRAWQALAFGMEVSAWTEECFETMLQFCDIEVGQSTSDCDIVKSYMDNICSAIINPARFVGVVSDSRRQWVCCSCGSVNPIKSGGFNIRNSTNDDFEVASLNGRVSLVLLPSSIASGAGCVFPCSPMRLKLKNPAACQRLLVGRLKDESGSGFACDFYRSITCDVSYVVYQ